jgi:hypothetical protein
LKERLVLRTKGSRYLDLDVKDTTFARFHNGGDSLFAGTIQVTGKFGMLYKAAAVEEGDEVLTGDKMVLDAIDLSGPRCARCV